MASWVVIEEQEPNGWFPGGAWLAKVLTGGRFCGNGRYCASEDEAREWAREAGYEVEED